MALQMRHQRLYCRGLRSCGRLGGNEDGDALSRRVIEERPSGAQRIENEDR